jgi:nucleotide-binding universal stress UspA family protein
MTTDTLRVLLAHDDSNAACAAEPWLTNARWSKPPEVTVLTVAAPALAARAWLEQPRQGELGGAFEQLEAAERASARQVAAEVAQRLRLAGLAATARTRNGEPAHEILAEAVAEESDLVMVGPRGRSEFTTALLGSVSQQVLSHARRPVLVARRGRMPVAELPDTVIVYVDGTAAAKAALDWLGKAGWLDGTHVVICGLLGTRAGLAAGKASLEERIHEEVRRAAGKALHELAEAVRGQARQVEVELKAGHPLQVALAADDVHLADLLVVARRPPLAGDQPFADKVARYAASSVLVVPVDDDEAAVRDALT